MKEYLEWDIKTTMKSGARIILNTEATPKLIDLENPDAVIVTTGSDYLIPDIPGIDGSNIKMLSDIERNKTETGNHVVVCGGGAAGVECALALAMQGKKVTVVDMLPANRLCRDIPFLPRVDLLSHAALYKINFLGDSKIISFNGNGVTVQNIKGEQSAISCDNAVIALGVKPSTSLGTQLRSKYSQGIVLAGDCAGGKDLYDANHTAFFAAKRI